MSLKDLLLKREQQVLLSQVQEMVGEVFIYKHQGLRNSVL
jgi:hypothetical protein